MEQTQAAVGCTVLRRNPAVRREGLHPRTRTITTTIKIAAAAESVAGWIISLFKRIRAPKKTADTNEKVATVLVETQARISYTISSNQGDRTFPVKENKTTQTTEKVIISTNQTCQGAGHWVMLLNPWMQSDSGLFDRRPEMLWSASWTMEKWAWSSYTTNMGRIVLWRCYGYLQMEWKFWFSILMVKKAWHFHLSLLRHRPLSIPVIYSLVCQPSTGRSTSMLQNLCSWFERRLRRLAAPPCSTQGSKLWLTQ